MTEQATSSALLDALRAHHVDFELIPHRRTTSAAAEARAIGVPAERVAKTLVLECGTELVRAVLPASERIDLDKVRSATDAREVRLASEQAIGRAYPEFELGAVPPLGGAHRDTVIVDRRLRDVETIVVEAGTHEQSVRLRAAALVAAAGATVADICAD